MERLRNSNNYFTSVLHLCLGLRHYNDLWIIKAQKPQNSKILTSRTLTMNNTDRH